MAVRNVRASPTNGRSLWEREEREKKRGGDDRGKGVRE
jgi:hypothetical protein